ncbi:MAG: aminopeptidase [Cytophagales bacterium]|nr:MAG: aminopeptidase [Cytophagales bacterium]
MKWLKILKKSLSTIGLMLYLGIPLLSIFYYDLAIYGIGQGYGQMGILWNTRPIKEVLEDTNFPDSLKNKVKLIEEIKTFATKELGIRPSENYTTLYDQRGKAILWIVTASDPYALHALEWNYGFLGDMSYKGFFNLQSARRMALKLQKEGYDVDIDEVSAWSTLGWFRDPILTSMLRRGEGSLAELIIHELTHGTLWITDEVEYNENLADFVGEKGAILFLEKKYGKNSAAYRKYIDDKQDNDKFFAHILAGAKKLDNFYKNLPKDLPEATKRKQKLLMIEQIIKNLDTVGFARKERFAQAFRIPLRNHPVHQIMKKVFRTDYLLYLPNNTYFMGFLRYRGKQNQFEEEYKTQFQSDFFAYFSYLKKKYGK